jgi:SAM-dependent methyltransferase
MSLPEWRLPPGVSRALWEYTHQPQIARQYDQSIAASGLAHYDQAVLDERFREPGRLVDLGCGSGRLAVHFAARGFDVLGVDLSLEMLRVLQEKAQAAGVVVAPLLANLCELDCLPSEQFDYALSMFSTLGMISGPDERLQALRQTLRILKPGGRFAVHAHNLWHNVFNPQGRRWLLRDRYEHYLRGQPGGDVRMHDRGIPHMYMHVFTRSEIVRLLQAAGFVVDEVLPLNATGAGPLRRPIWWGGLRANGWILVAHRPR